MRNGKGDGIPRLRIKKGDDLKAVYAKARKAFSAADLQRYTEIEPGVPFAKVLAELEAIQRQESRKQKKNKKT